MVKKESEKTVRELLDLYQDDRESILKEFTKSLIRKDYTSESIGRALAEVYDILW